MPSNNTPDASTDVDKLIVDAMSRAAKAAVPVAIPSGKKLRVEHIQHTERSSTAIAVIEAGGGLRPHFHRYHDEIIVFLSGDALFRIGDEVRPVKAFDIITVPAGVIHATLHAHTPCILAAVFSPFFDLANEDRIYVD